MANPIVSREVLSMVFDALGNKLGYELYADFAQLQYQWGLRFGDCAAITHNDYLYLMAHGHLFLRESKTGKSRPLSANDVVLVILSKYYREASDLSIWGARPIVRETFNLRLKAAAELVGVDPAYVSSHSLRKSFGYHLRQRGVSLDAISEHYGHANVSITRRYAGLDTADRLTLTSVPL